MGNSKIEWTDEVWNPVTGCTKVSAGCKNCYAERMSKRLAGRVGYPAAPHNFDVVYHPDRLSEPMRWRKPLRVFVCSMGDLFHKDVPDWAIREVFWRMDIARQHTFQVLTKRPERMAEWLADKPCLPNVWLGTSVENQQAADERIPWLVRTPAAVRFLSCEPLLGPVDLNVSYGQGVGDLLIDGLGWCIAGGESGPGARPMHPNWARSLRDQCNAAGVAFFHKQNGEWLATGQVGDAYAWNDNTPEHRFEDGLSVWRIGKKAAGSLLDGREWKEYPGGAK